MRARTRGNKKTWNNVSDLFIEASSLPAWGPFSVGENLDLIGKIKGRGFLEIACGSGRSIKYLLDRGAKKVYGLDFSEKQLAEAERYNKKYAGTGRLRLINKTMEEKIEIEPVDVVFSIYGIGWTENPKKTLANIYSYLKPGGLFIWSWDHTIFTDVVYERGKFVVVYSYHKENPITIKNWKKKGYEAHITYRKTATWFKLLKVAGFEIESYYEPEPRDLKRGSNDPQKHYSIQKARLLPSTFIFGCRKLK
jgi:SAM-dependent methyltransferase